MSDRRHFYDLPVDELEAVVFLEHTGIEHVAKLLGREESTRRDRYVGRQFSRELCNVSYVSAIRFEKNSFVSLATTPPSMMRPMRLGKAMNPFNRVPMAQTRGTGTTAPIKIRIV